MDPDRFQMKDLKRRVRMAEKSAQKANDRIDRLNTRIVNMATASKQFEAMLKKFFPREFMSDEERRLS